jgi:hypothetical protein
MNHMLPIPPLVLLALLAAEVLPNKSPQVVDTKSVAARAEVSAAAPAAPTAPRPVTGQELVSQAAQRLLLLPGIEASTRQKISIFGQQLVGSGTYLQLANGPRLMLRLDLKLRNASDEVAARSSFMQQISDGDTFWVRRSQGEETTLTRVNVRRLRDTASQIGPSDAPPPATLWMALGGLPKLLSALDAHFEFGTPTPTVVGKEKLPVWSIEGHWRPAILANLLPEQQQAILAGEPADLSKLPPHLPHGVTLILGRDQVIPLFPYGISYYRYVAVDGASDAQPARQSMVSWELFDVHFRPDLDTSLFDYRPHDNQQVDERTDEYIARLRAAMKK